MTSKEQERKALEKIRKIVAELGEDSYLAAAFEGCFEDADRNIDEDAAYSMKARLESAEAAYDRCFNSLQVEREDRKRKEEKMRRELEGKDEQIARLAEEANRLREETNALRQDRIEAERRGQEAVMEARRDLEMETKDDTHTTCFKRIEYINANGFRFFTVTERNGWTNSYKLDDITKFVIE